MAPRVEARGENNTSTYNVEMETSVANEKANNDNENQFYQLNSTTSIG